MRYYRHVLLALLVLLASVGLGSTLVQVSERPIPVPMVATAVPGAADAVVDLQRKLDSGQLRLEFADRQGYLRSVLKNLAVPISSQSLVFSKSSFQFVYISPENPRALYFNDDVYVGFVQGGLALELTAMDPATGPVFYTILQDKEAPQQFERRDSGECTVCHDTFQADTAVPRLLMLSVLPRADGVAINAEAFVTNDLSPFKQRWGGWYVTGTHGSQRHLGNMTVKVKEDTKDIAKVIPQLDLDAGANVTDLKARIDTRPYLAGDSDIVALAVLGHQTDVDNQMVAAAYAVRAAEAQPGKDVAAVVKEEGESVVRALLFSGAVPFEAPIKGTSGFAAEFSAKGPRDSHGRSLRELDLKTRLFRYPLSYRIYSASFDHLPEALKSYIYGRLWQVLDGSDTSKPFAHLSADDRKELSEILTETKPAFAAAGAH